MKKNIVLVGIAAISVLGATAVKADSKNDTTSDIPSVLLDNDKVKDTDTLIKIPGGVYVHGKITIEKNDKVIATLDSDNNPEAKTLKTLKMGESIKTVGVPIISNKRYDSPTPPVYEIKLGQDAYDAGVWDVNYGGIHYTPYAYEATNPAADLLYWKASRDSMYVGGSEVWNNPTQGQVILPGEGSYINPLYNNSAAWTYSPFVAGASWYVGNVWAK